MVSVAAHAAAAVFAAVSLPYVASRVEFAGNHSSIHLEAVTSIAPALEPPSVEHATLLDTAVEVRPLDAQIGETTYRHTPADQVPVAELELAELLTADSFENKTSSLELERDDIKSTYGSPLEQVSHLPHHTPRRPLSTLTPITPMSVSLPQPTGNDDKTPPDFSNNAPPAYPRIAWQRGWQGTVLLELHIGADGTVSQTKVVRSSGYEVLDAAAAIAVRQWTGQPAYQGNRPVATVETLPVHFRLK